MRLLSIRLHLMLLVFSVAVSVAAPLPIGSMYFYPCSDGAVDCDAFQHHNFLGPDGAIPASEPTNWDSGTLEPWSNIFWRAASNSSGQAIGSAHNGSGYGVVYGLGPDLDVVLWGPLAPHSLVGDINESGVWALTGPGYPMMALVGQGPNYLGSIGPGLWMGSGPDPHVGFILEIEAINENNQLLVSIGDFPVGGSPFYRGVLSPYMVPEPSTAVMMLAGLLGLLVVRHIRRRAKGAWRRGRP